VRGLDMILFVLKRKKKDKVNDHLLFIKFVMPSAQLKHYGSSQVCLVGWLGSDSGIHNWWFSCCSWHNPKSGAVYIL
jgi:hypothetical protein